MFVTSSPDPAQIAQQVALAQVRETYADLDQWRLRARELEDPQPGSELAADTSATHGMGMPLHDLARHPLISATQHLNMARVCLEDAKQLFPIAHPTALRGGLLGASRGVWMLHPDDPAERQLRAARVALEMHSRLLEWIQEPENGLDPVDRTKARTLVEGLVGDLSSRPGIRALTYGDTRLVKSAGQVVFADSHAQGAVVALWRQLSGDAHGLAWSAVTRAATERTPVGRDPRYPQRMSELRVGGDLREMVDAFWAAYRILKVGWALFDKRCTAP